MRQYREEPLHHVRPRRAGRGEMQEDSFLAFDPCEHLLVLVGRVVVQDDVDFLTLGNCFVDLSQESQHLLVAVLTIGLADHPTRCHIQRREQRGRTVTLVIVRHRRAATLLHWQTGLGAVQRLDLTLLIEAEHRSVPGWVEVQPNHVAQLLFEARVIAELERANQVRLEPMGTPHPVDEAVGRAQMPGHRPARPMRRVVRRRLCRRLDDFATQSRLRLGVLAPVVRAPRAFLPNARCPLSGDTTSPTPDFVRVNPELCGNGFVRHAFGCHQHNARSLAHAHRSAARRCPLLQCPLLFLR